MQLSAAHHCSQAICAFSSAGRSTPGRLVIVAECEMCSGGMYGRVSIASIISKLG
jgi:hypothetical protein